MKHVKYPSIEQFRHTVATINRQATFVGLDDKGEAIHDETLPKPKLTFTGTVKLHGTNAAVSIKGSELWAQSRENIVTPQKDNAGFATYVHGVRDIFRNLYQQIQLDNKHIIGTDVVSIYGEWVGKGIQSGVAISNIEKSFFVFGVKVSPEEEGVPAYWVDSSKISSPENRIYNIFDYKTYEIEIDFNHPQLSQNEIVEMTLEVEECCPVAKELGFVGVGEGIVFHTIMPDGTRHLFKSKGEKHSKSKVKVLREVDDNRINNLILLAEKVTPSWRLEQMLTETFDLNNGGSISREKLGDYIKAVINDVIKEDLDLIIERGFEPKDLGKYVSDISRKYFFEQEKQFNPAKCG